MGRVNITPADFTRLTDLPQASDANSGNLFAVFDLTNGTLRKLGIARLVGIMARLFGIYLVADPKYGTLDTTGATDCTQVIVNAIADMPSTVSQLVFPPGTIRHSGIGVTRRGIRWIGARDGRPSQGGGTRLRYQPTAQQQLAPCSAIAMGTSGVAGDPYFDPTYENGPGGVKYGGIQESYFENISFECYPATGGTLANAANTYGVNTCAVRDYYGGSVRMFGVQIEQFDYPFWGVHSDFNHFENVLCVYCNHGPYLGPRSDQHTTINLQCLAGNDGLWLDRCINGTHIGYRGIDCGDGAGTRFGLKITNQYTADACYGHTFIGNWHEIGAGAAPPVQTIESFVQLGGDTDAFPVRDITFIRPTIITALQSQTPHAVYFAHIGNARRIRLEGLTGGFGNLAKYFVFTGTFSSHVHVEAHADYRPTYDNLGTGTPVVSWQATGYGDHMFGGANGRLNVVYLTQPSNYAYNYFFGSESQFGFFVNFPNLPTAGGTANLLAITRRVQHGAAAPVAGTWNAGDMIINNAPAELGVAGSKYIILAWSCVGTGTPGTWLQCRVLTGN